MIKSLLVDPSHLLVAPVILAVSYFVWGGCIATLCCVSGIADCQNACGIQGGPDLREHPTQMTEVPFLDSGSLMSLDGSQELTDEMCTVKY